jgi:DNA polymerase III delta prime subunit
MSFAGTRKYVILDEADYLNPNSTQPALRNFMEEFSKNCGFILTCNNKNRIIRALQSRAPVLDFSIKQEEMPKLASQFMKRAEFILNEEKVPFDKKVLSVVISKHFPDWRRILNELQRYSATGAIDNGILSKFQELPIKEVIKLCKTKEFEAIRKWTSENSDLDQNDVFSLIYENADMFFTKRSIPVLILKIAEYQYKGSFVANQELNILAFFVEIIRECEFL